jgi:hypothetical protein
MGNTAQKIAMLRLRKRFNLLAAASHRLHAQALVEQSLGPVGGRTVFTRSRVAILFVAALLVMAGFIAGFRVCLHLRGYSPGPAREQNLAQSGNAPLAVRSSIVERLHTLQQGYAQRDPKQIDAFTHDLFADDGDVLILGTEGGTEEWVRSGAAARQFIAEDWRGWGDLRLDVDHAIVWSSGSAAWVATIGSVQWKTRERPIRFTAVLTREEDRWVFRLMHFQWDDKDPSASDLLRSRTYLSLLPGAIH